MSVMPGVSEAGAARQRSASFAILASKSDGALALLDRIGRPVTLRRDQALFHEGDAARYGFKVIAGALRSCRLLADGRRHITEFFLPGDYVGLNGEETHGFTAEAVSAASLVQYPLSAVEKIASAQPQVSKSLLALLRQHLSAAQQQMLLLGRKNAVERIASFLLAMGERSDDSEHVLLPMTRGDIADHLGLTTETVSRVFTQLKAQHVIQLKSTTEVRVTDVGALEELAAAA